MMYVLLHPVHKCVLNRQVYKPILLHYVAHTSVMQNLKAFGEQDAFYSKEWG